ncbi:MAG: TIR domain-containing protein [Steroidobacteraceae bacterium]
MGGGQPPTDPLPALQVPNASSDVFISYASQDAAVAEAIVEALERQRLKCWIAPRDVTAGAPYAGQIIHAIDAAKASVLVLSRDATASPHVLREVERTASKRHSIVALRIDQAPLPADFEYFLNASHWLDTSAGDIGRALPRLVVAVQLALQPPAVTSVGAPTSHASAPAVSARPPKKMAMIVASVIGLGLLGFAADRLWLSHRQAAPPPAPALAPAASAPAATPAAPTIPEKSIAVLPFADMSEQKDQEYFADGLAEELIDLLAKTPGLWVIARTSSFSFKGKSDDIPTIAAKLKVANLLEGSVRKSGRRLRVSTQLVRAADGEHLWSQTYDRELKDVFRLQDEIAQAVVTAMKLKLSPAAQGSWPSHPSNTDAYLQYLLGRQYVSRHNADSFRRAVAAYRSAVALDPHYAAAYAGLAFAEAFLADITGDTAGLERASGAAERAIELAPEQAQGYAARGFLRAVFAWNWTGAEADLAKALRLDANDPPLLNNYASVLWGLGRLPQAIAIASKAVDLDPLSTRSRYYLASCLISSGDLDAARAVSRDALAIDPTNEFVLSAMGTIELLQHKYADALAVFQKIRGDETNQLGFRLTGIAMAEHSLGHANESKQALDDAIAKTAQSMAYQIAEAYAWRGEADKAFEWLERAYRQRDGGLAGLKVDPLFSSLRSDPRYAAMLKKINLPG